MSDIAKEWMNAIAKRPDLMCIKRQPYSYSERTKNKLDLFQDDRTSESLMVNNFSNFVSCCYTYSIDADHILL